MGSRGRGLRMGIQGFRFGEVVRTAIPITLLGLGVFGFVVLKQRDRVPARPKPKPSPPLVETMAVRRHSGPVTLQTHGEVVPFREVIVSAEVAGRVVEKTEACRAGRFVRRGQLLLQIDRKDYELERRRLAAELAQADVDLHQVDVEISNTEALLVLAQKEVQLQQSEWKRQVDLLARKATSPASVDQAERALLQARNSEQTLRNQLNLLTTRKERLRQAKELAAIRLEQADLNLARTRVVAPVDGVIVTESVQEDAFVQKGTALATIHDTSAVEVETRLRMEELFWI
ncbi:MAG TPA: HlyD family efflux transporter periplasmic adaptor subunit, partial [Planctomycetaceae bacterium]|nr:HlyD family efflux transporter periplasmic adaptor subunit [Planctomycetaceae bacterium]